MAEGKRPGGLTALAVLNFVFGGIGAIVGLLGLLGMALLREAAKQAEANHVKYDRNLTLFMVSLVFVMLGAFLLITSGVGYIKQKKMMGRTLGTVYGLVSLTGTALGVASGDGIGIGTIIFSVYPVLTLIMVNTTFKDDLVN